MMAKQEKPNEALADAREYWRMSSDRTSITPVVEKQDSDLRPLQALDQSCGWSTKQSRLRPWNRHADHYPTTKPDSVSRVSRFCSFVRI